MPIIWFTGDESHLSSLYKSIIRRLCVQSDMEVAHLVSARDLEAKGSLYGVGINSVYITISSERSHVFVWLRKYVRCLSWG